MRIKEGLFPPEPHIRRDLTSFKHGGFSTQFLGLPCTIIRKVNHNGYIAIAFFTPITNVKLQYSMHISEIEYI